MEAPPQLRERDLDLALFCALGGGAVAAVNLRSGEVKRRHTARDAITSPKVRDFSLLRRDFRRNQLPRGARGAQGAAGSDASVNGVAAGGALTGTFDMHSGGDATRLTAPIDGFYRADVAVTWDTNAAGRRELWGLVERVSGATDLSPLSRVAPVSGGSTLHTGRNLMRLSAGDKVSFRGVQTSAGVLDVLGGDAALVWLGPLS
ncbi:MAG: hypothetical protein M3141_03645 [Actinomycetota bacterium]|nr:hypothetical protein [Actinomycetota bacterium]